jgi:hypothetical protein
MQPDEIQTETAPAEQETSLLDVIGQAVDSESEPEQEAAEVEEPTPEPEAESAEVAPAPEAAAPAEPVKTEPDDELAVPDDLKGRTRERFEKLTATLKTTREEAQQARTYAENWRKTIESTQAPPEAVGETLEILRLIHSGDPAQMGQALDKMEQARANLAKALGRDLPGVDALDDFPDLREEVSAGDLTKKRALEIAATRRAQQAVQGRQQAQTAEQQRQQLIDTSAAEVDALLAGLKGTDPAYAARMSVLQPMLRSIAANTPPERWASAVRDAYAAVQVQTPPVQRVHQPIRPSPTGAGSSPGKAPASVLDAINAALG